MFLVYSLSRSRAKTYPFDCDHDVKFAKFCTEAEIPSVIGEAFDLGIEAVTAIDVSDPKTLASTTVFGLWNLLGRGRGKLKEVPLTP